MDLWDDTEVISVDDYEETDDGEDRMKDSGDETDEEIFSQEPQADDEEFTIGRARNFTRPRKAFEEDDDEEEATIGDAMDYRQQQQRFGLDPQQEGYNVPCLRSRPLRSEAFSASENTVDLTQEVPTPNTVSGHALSFQDEYEELLAGVEGEGAGPGVWFPFEAIAELLLRHPEHWWCRYRFPYGALFYLYLPVCR